MKVVGVLPRSNGSLVKFEDGSEAWTPGTVEDVQAWGGTVPPTFDLRDGKRGKVLVERKQGGPPAYRNTKEAFEAEAASRRAWQLVEEDRRDRRTALMQAVQLVNTRGAQDETLQTADLFYDWLKDHQASVSAKGKGGAETVDGGADEGISLPGSTSPGYPVDPKRCKHKNNRGGRSWRKTEDGTEVCDFCGTPKVSAMEGTTADLGSA